MGWRGQPLSFDRRPTAIADAAARVHVEADSHTGSQAERNGGPQWCEKCSAALMARVRQAPLVTAEGGR